MNTCANKISCKPVPKCTLELVIGAVAANTNVIVKLKNLATGRIEKFPENSDGSGIVKIGLDDYELMCVGYSVQIFNEALTDQLFISVENESDQEIYFDVEDCNSETDSYTLSLK